MLSAVPHEIFEQSEFLGSEHDLSTATRDRMGHAIQLEVVQSKHGLCVVDAAAKQRAHASRQLSESERLENEIIGSQIQHLCMVLRLGSNRKHQNRQPLAPRANFP